MDVSTNPVEVGCARAPSFGERAAGDPSRADAFAFLRKLESWLDAPITRGAGDGAPVATPWIVRRLTFPLLLGVTLAVIAAAIGLHWNLRFANLWLWVGTLALLTTLEFAYPLERHFGVTLRNFVLRDLKFTLSIRVLSPVGNISVQWAALWLSEHHKGLIADWPLWAAVPATMLALELQQYWWHRLSHDASNPVTRAMWRLHVAHHLPDQLYALMRTVANPLHAFIVATPMILLGLGAAPETVFAVGAFNTFLALISHSNLDLRLGWLNYVFTGPEIHRMHHSAEDTTSNNYAGCLPLFDIVFGTFVYQPEKRPRRYGVSDPESYPLSTEFLRTTLLPFRGLKPAREAQ